MTELARSRPGAAEGPRRRVPTDRQPPRPDEALALWRCLQTDPEAIPPHEAGGALASLPARASLLAVQRHIGNRAFARTVATTTNAAAARPSLQRKLTGSGKVRTETTLGEVNVVEEFTLGTNKYFVLTRTSDEAKFVHSAKEDRNIPYAEWSSSPWRTWKGDVDTEGEDAVTTTRTDRPPSTDRIPLTLYKRVNVKHLKSISQTPLESTAGRVVFQGYSKGSRYMNRDLALAAVWLGRSTEPGEGMQPSTGDFIDLKIQVSTAFRDAYLRDIQAVLHGDDEAQGDTILSFAPIPPNLVFVTVDATMLEAIKAKDGNSRLRVGDNQLSRVDGRDIDSIEAYLAGDGDE